MRKRLFVIGLSVLLIIVALSGCQEEGATVEGFENVNFESDILQMVEGNVERIIGKNGVIDKIEVSIRFKNILEDTINLKLAVDFCDVDDNILYTANKNINFFYGGYTERLANVFSYDGEGRNDFDHVNVRIVEYTILEE